MRMGSTWQFNVIRALLRENNLNYSSEFVGNFKDPIEVFKVRNDNFLIKTHLYDPRLIQSISEITEVKVFFSLRNIHDALCSIQRVSPETHLSLAKRDLAQSLKFMLKLGQSDIGIHLTLIDEVSNRKLIFEEVKKMSEFLNLQTPIDILEQISDSLSRENVKKEIDLLFGNSKDFELADRITQWHSNHLANDLELGLYSSTVIASNTHRLTNMYERVTSSITSNNLKSNFSIQSESGSPEDSRLVGGFTLYTYNNLIRHIENYKRSFSFKSWKFGNRLMQYLYKKLIVKTYRKCQQLKNAMW